MTGAEVLGLCAGGGCRREAESVVLVGSPARMARPDEQDAKSREECARLMIYQSMRDTAKEPIYHPTLVGSDFFRKTGGLL